MTFHRSLLPSTQGAGMLVVQMTTQTLYPCREQQSTAHTPQCSPNELFCERRAPILSKMQTLTPAEVSKNGGILLANLLQSSRSTLSRGSFFRFLAFKEGMLSTPISVLGGWPTVSERFSRQHFLP